MSDILNDRGYQVDVALEGYTALRLLERQTYALALVDLRMPGMDGLTLCREAKRLRPAMVAFLITAYAANVPPAERRPPDFARSSSSRWTFRSYWLGSKKCWPADQGSLGTDRLPVEEIRPGLKNCRGIRMNQELETDSGVPRQSLDQIGDRIQRWLGGRVLDFQVMCDEQGVVLRGRANTHHAKQLAQQAVMELISVPIRANEIRVARAVRNEARRGHSGVAGQLPRNAQRRGGVSARSRREREP